MYGVTPVYVPLLTRTQNPKQLPSESPHPHSRDGDFLFGPGASPFLQITHRILVRNSPALNNYRSGKYESDNHKSKREEPPIYNGTFFKAMEPFVAKYPCYRRGNGKGNEKYDDILTH